MKKFLSILATIGKDVEAGLALATPIVGVFVPQVTPILSGVEAILGAYEKGGVTLTQTQTAAIVSAVATHQAITQHANSLQVANAALQSAAGVLTTGPAGPLTAQ